MDKIDLKKEMKHLYGAKARPQLVDVPEMKFLMVDGAGDPKDSAPFQEALQLLYGLSYTIKFDLKKTKMGPDYSVMPLEGLWWLEGGKEFDIGLREDWVWTLMMAQPDHVTQENLDSAKLKLQKKEPSLPISSCRLESFQEGKCVQILHTGPYATEPETIEIMRSFLAENGMEQRGKHHEIYLSDPRRTNTLKLKTILRHPVK